MFNTSLNNGGSEKVGIIKAFGGSVAPFGWLICDGSAISRTLYAALFDVIGETYGAGDGTTTFNLPNGKMPLGNNARCLGDGKGIGFKSNSYQCSLTVVTTYGFFESSTIDAEIGSSASGAGSGAKANIIYGLDPDSTKSHVIVDLTTASAASLAIIKY